MHRGSSRLLQTTVFAVLLAAGATTAAALEGPAGTARIVVRSGPPGGVVHPAPSEPIVVPPRQAISSIQPGQLVVLFVQPALAATAAASPPEGGVARVDGDPAASRSSPYADRNSLGQLRDEQRFPSER